MKKLLFVVFLLISLLSVSAQELVQFKLTSSGCFIAPNEEGFVVFSFCYIVHGVISIQVRYNLRPFKSFVLYDRRSVMRTTHSSFCHGRAVRDAPQAC